MQASRQPTSKLSWVDYSLVHKGKTARNDLAHRAVIASKKDCHMYIQAVGAELYEWGLITSFP